MPRPWGKRVVHTGEISPGGFGEGERRGRLVRNPQNLPFPLGHLSWGGLVRGQHEESELLGPSHWGALSKSPPLLVPQFPTLVGGQVTAPCRAFQHPQREAHSSIYSPGPQGDGMWGWEGPQSGSPTPSAMVRALPFSPAV